MDAGKRRRIFFYIRTNVTRLFITIVRHNGPLSIGSRKTQTLWYCQQTGNMIDFAAARSQTQEKTNTFIKEM